MNERADRSSSFVAASPRLTLVGGKGGVGKTTTAAAIAVALADSGRPTLAVSVDPAHSLGDALGVRLGPDPHPVPEVERLTAMEVDPEEERQRFLESHRGALLSLLERGTYLDSSDAAALVDLTVPGLDELAALFRLRTLLREERTLVVDTAPTGHTLRLLDLPDLARAWLGALRAMEDRTRAVSTALVGAYRPDEASELLAQLDRELAEISGLLRDRGRTRFILVAGREPVVLAETLRYQSELEDRGIAVGAVVVNRSAPAPRVAPDVEGRMIFVPVLDPEPVGVEGARRFAALLEAPQGGVAPGGRTVAPTTSALSARAAFEPPTEHALYMVGGKGGVGKSTAASALAIHLVRNGRRVLLLGADPAGSLADVLALPAGAEGGPVPGLAGLTVRQLESEREWEEFRSEYRAEAERLFAGLVSPGTGADGDVVRRLVDLAPPGMDELAALMEVVDLTGDRPYDAVVLDTAPTGHFLRLLELPDVVLEWTHQAMRLLLKYREVVAPGELGERLLKLSRALRSFRNRLRDPVQTWMLVVALPESLSLPETTRLLARLRELEIAPGALLLNRALRNGVVGAGASAVLDSIAVAAGGVPLLGAPALEHGPRGVEELDAFVRSWRDLRVGAS